MSSNHTDITFLISQTSQQQTQGPQAALQPVSYGHPEKAPLFPRLKSDSEAPKDHVEIHEVVEHQPEPEVQPYVEPRPEKVQVPQDLQDVGVESTGSTQFPSYNSIKLPISDDRVLQGLHRPISSSLRWLAEFCLHLLKKAHIRLRMAHGKAVRMFEAS